jgi:hypothetical protein
MVLEKPPHVLETLYSSWTISNLLIQSYIRDPTQVALFSAELGRYDVAIPIFEDTARAAVQNNLLKFSARGHLLNAGICHLCSASRTRGSVLGKASRT